jgi:hypothetical protein
MKKLFREPLVHFALIGDALFVLYGVVNDSGSAGTDSEIVVSAGRSNITNRSGTCGAR